MLVKEDYTRAVFNSRFVQASPNYWNDRLGTIAPPGGTVDVRKTAVPKRVLVVEDNLDSVHALTLLLRYIGHNVEYAINGYVGIDVAQRFRPEFVLLDLGLPGLDGFEVCRRIKREPALLRTRVIAITAFAQDEYRVRSKEAGCEMHLVKPVPTRVLEELLG